MTPGMYGLARLLLMLASLSGAYSVALLIVLGWPASGWIGAMIALVLLGKRRPARLTTLGSAQFAEEEELRRAGMLDAESGLIIGRLPATLRGGSGSPAAKLFDRRIKAKDACGEFWSGFMKSQGPVVRLRRAVHTAIFSPSGGGKGASFVVPFLLTCPESCIVVDFKGENAALTAAHRAKVFGHRVVLLDPFKVVTQTPDCLNVVDFIDKDDPEAIDQCNDIAKAIVVRSPDEKEPHWSDSAEAWLAAVLATVVWYCKSDESRSLQTVHALLSDPRRLEMAVKLMCESDCWSGMLARMGGHLQHFVEKEKASTLTSVGRHLRFLATPAIAESTSSSSFDLRDLRKGKMTVFLVLPPDHMRAQSNLLRLWITSLLQAVVKGGLQDTHE